MTLINICYTSRIIQEEINEDGVGLSKVKGIRNKNDKKQLCMFLQFVAFWSTKSLDQLRSTEINWDQLRSTEKTVILSSEIRQKTKYACSNHNKTTSQKGNVKVYLRQCTSSNHSKQLKVFQLLQNESI